MERRNFALNELASFSTEVPHCKFNCLDSATFVKCKWVVQAARIVESEPDNFGNYDFISPTFNVGKKGPKKTDQLRFFFHLRYVPAKSRVTLSVNFQKPYSSASYAWRGILVNNYDAKVTNLTNWGRFLSLNLTRPIEDYLLLRNSFILVVHMAVDVMISTLPLVNPSVDDLTSLSSLVLAQKTSLVNSTTKFVIENVSNNYDFLEYPDIRAECTTQEGSTKFAYTLQPCYDVKKSRGKGKPGQVCWNLRFQPTEPQKVRFYCLRAYILKKNNEQEELSITWVNEESSVILLTSCWGLNKSPTDYLMRDSLKIICHVVVCLEDEQLEIREITEMPLQSREGWRLGSKVSWVRFVWYGYIVFKVLKNYR